MTLKVIVSGASLPGMKNSHEYSAVVLGAGPAGAGTAWNLAKAGLRTVVLERRALGLAGPSWVNAIPPWMFDRAGIERPRHPELVKGAAPMLMIGPGNSRVTVPENPTWHIDMRALVRRLQEMAVSAGATLIMNFEPRRVVLRNDRPVAIEGVATSNTGITTEESFSAALFVDATGIDGWLRSRVPALAKVAPLPCPSDVCMAGEEAHEIVDRRAAKAFFASHGVDLDTAINWMAPFGGFSTLMIFAEDDFRRIFVLAGTIADGQQPSGPTVVEWFIKKHPWIGPKIFGGAARIPLRRPYARFTVPGVALVGNSAGQVFPAHASGVGAALIAAKMLGSAVSGASDPGDEAVLWRYQAEFQREIGSIHGAYDALRRFFQPLDPGRTDYLLSTGFMGARSSFATLEQRMSPPAIGDAIKLARVVTGDPSWIGPMANVGGRIALLTALGQLYPRHPNVAGLQRWANACGAVLGDRPDRAK